MAALLPVPQGLGLPIVRGPFFNTDQTITVGLHTPRMFNNVFQGLRPLSSFGVGQSLAVFKDLIALCI